MKKQLLSLVLLSAVIGSTVSARAQSDVPDNMLQARSAVDVLTNNDLAQSLSPWEDCTESELKDGSCVKDLFPGYQIANRIPVPAGMQLQITILTNKCYNQIELTLPNQYRIRLQARDYFVESGMYSTVNQSGYTCQVHYQLIKR